MITNKQREQRQAASRALVRIVSRVSEANAHRYPNRRPPSGFKLIAEAYDPPITWQSVQRWAKTGNVPADRIEILVRLGDGVATAHDLRPAAYPPGFAFPNSDPSADRR